MPLPNHNKLQSASVLPIFEDAMAPYFSGVDVQPLFFDARMGIWVLRVLFHPGVLLSCHDHASSVFLSTTSGTWRYVERPQLPLDSDHCQATGEGARRLFMTPADHREPTETTMVVYGANASVDESNPVDIWDAGTIVRAIGRLVDERGMEPSRYIRQGPAGFSIG